MDYGEFQYVTKKGNEMESHVIEKGEGPMTAVRRVAKTAEDYTCQERFRWASLIEKAEVGSKLGRGKKPRIRLMRTIYLRNNHLKTALNQQSNENQRNGEEGPCPKRGEMGSAHWMPALILSKPNYEEGKRPYIQSRASKPLTSTVRKKATSRPCY